MDHFSLGATTRHHSHNIGGGGGGGGNPAKFRISPVNFSGPGRQHPNNNGGGNGSSQHQHLYNFGLQSSLFGRGGLGANPSNFMNTNPPNHFNFPLRSNLNGGGGGARAGFSRGGMNNSQIANHNLNKTRSNNQQHNNRSSSGGGGSNGQGRFSDEGGSGSTRVQAVQEPQPQYRIFKRGDSIPGIMSPTGVASGGSDDREVLSEKLDSSDCSEGKPNGQNKENTAISKDVDGNVVSSQPNKTPVSQVSDVARFHNLAVEYRLVGEKGPPHNPTFTVALHFGPNEQYVGQGSSIKRAQHAAAIEALNKTALSRPTSRSQPKRAFVGKRPNWALLQLTALAEELKEPVSIVQQPITIMNPFNRGDPQSVVSVHVGERIFSGEGNNFNTAKNMALMIALKAMIKVKQEMEFRTLGAEDGSLNLDNKSPISVVHEMAMKREQTVQFEVTNEDGPPHSKVFTVVCALGVDEEIKTEGQGPTKQAAKKVASELMISKLAEMPVHIRSSEVTSLKAIQRGLFRQKTPRKKSSVPVVKDLQKQSVSPISRLIQIAHIRKYKEPEFTVVDSTVNSLPEDPIALKLMSERERRSLRKKKPSFTIEVSVGPYSSKGTSSNKKSAKKAAAEAVLIEMGYGATEGEELSGGSGNDSNSGAHHDKSLGKGVKSSDFTKIAKSKETSKSLSSGGNGRNNVSARQIVPGVLVLREIKPKDSPDSSPSKNSALAHEMNKVNSLAASSSTSSSRDGIEKLAYLAKLLDVSVSYSDFPKKNEFLSVVSIRTTPPQVAHGCGATLEEAQNTAAIRILEDLSEIGIDNVNPSDSGFSATGRD